MSSKNYIPSADADFQNWLSNFVAYASANTVALGISAPQLDPIEAGQSDFVAAYAAHLTAVVTAKSKREDKVVKRKDVQAAVRGLVKVIQANPSVTDVQRLALGITVPKTTKTPVPVPTSRPMPQVEEIEELQHVLKVVDDVTDKVAKPDGVFGAEVWMKIVPAGGPAPVDPDELDMVSVATTSKVTSEFTGTDAGKTAYYRLRWVNTKGQKGPWGPQVGATIAA